MFINFWYAVCWSTELADAPYKARMLGQDFVLFRDENGRAHCLSNTCVHRGGALASGNVRGSCIECPYHGWRFDGEGHCLAIPSLGKGAKIPGRVRVDAYPTQEKYGLVFAFLGDLPEEERPPNLEIPEFGEEGWAHNLQDFDSEVNYRRAIENALDPAHNEFVHSTHGFAGSADDQRVPELEFLEDEWGVGFMTRYVAPPLPDEKMRSASGRPDTGVVEAGSKHHGPTSGWTKIHPGPDIRIHQWAWHTPIDEFSERVFLVQTRNFVLGEENNERFKERNAMVAEEDRVVINRLKPRQGPWSTGHEFLVPTDKAVVGYREYLKEWKQRGWCIDTQRVAETRKKIAYAIPSPARREQSAWVLDSVPLIQGGEHESTGQVAGEA